ncbi:monosaccharide ABC transporter substrate-binding protein, CUT2 family [Bacillus sp. OV166]|uniref:ABC transporter substrate-binding protein n=1 Tax=unclassified Bacillus (in: firmicutes) TaxID=185979 RepID=UPI000A2AEC6A|nr:MULTISPECIES: ABC transporter substrate-binding protein [unclassified Bacillus (in: firmicutes)]PGY06609.1 ribose ABC transporter ATP-binding protein [Bacillus sp. AFS031507]SMQ63683.1 monosaccharide ABC transporter substrate-binding protein, CUT2 family [Bacillus sp. OV166]
MRINVKMLLILVLMFVMVVMTACTSASESSSESTKDNKEQKGDKKLTIGLTVGTLANPFFVAMSKGVEEAGKELGAEVFVESAEYDLAKQTSQIENFITKNVDVILLNAVDTKGIAAAVQQAKDAGIPVIAVDTNAEGGVDATVTSDNYQAGKLAGEYVIEQLGGKGNIAIIDGPPVSAVTDRIKGFEDAIKDSKIKIVAKQNGEGNREKALTVMESILQANPSGSIDAVFAINDPEAIGVEIAQEQADRKDEFFIVGVDGAPEVTEAMAKKGSTIKATSAQSPSEMVKKAVEIGMKVKNGEDVEDLIKVPVKLVTQDKLDSYQGW